MNPQREYEVSRYYHPYFTGTETQSQTSWVTDKIIELVSNRVKA